MALKGVRVLEFAGLAPTPLCGMILADYGARVIRIDRLNDNRTHDDTLCRGKQSIAINLKSDQGVSIVKKLCTSSDVLLEPFRPGIMEKFGLSPNILLKENPQLIYARLTGYGQYGPYKNKAGHDLNYLAISGVLSKLGRHNENPSAPINLLADFAGGGLLCAFGIVTALFQRVQTGRGQVLDANMVEGAAYVSSFLFTSKHQKFLWGGKSRGLNLFDGGSPIYDTYETQDGKYLAVACLEPQFARNFLKGVGLDDVDVSEVYGPNTAQLKRRLVNIIKAAPLDHWVQRFVDLDACVTPVLDADSDEAANDAHNAARKSFLSSAQGGRVPAPSPRFSDPDAATLANDVVVDHSLAPGQHTTSILAELGYSQTEIQALKNGGVVGCVENASKAKL